MTVVVVWCPDSGGAGSGRYKISNGLERPDRQLLLAAARLLECGSIVRAA